MVTTRKKIRRQRTWRLDDILALADYPARVVAAEKSLDELTLRFEGLNSSVSPAEFANFLEAAESLTTELSRLTSRLDLMEALDWRDPDAARFRPLIHRLTLAGSALARQLDQWLSGRRLANKIALDDATARSLFASVPKLEYRLWRKRQAARHLLSEAEEKIIDHKDLNLATPLLDLHDIRETEEEYELRLPGRRPRRIKSRAVLMGLASDHRAAYRRGSYQAFLRVKDHSAHQSFLIYQAVVRDWGDEARWRNYPSPISVRNQSNDLPEAVPEALLSAVTVERGVFQDFFRLKARRLGVKNLSRFDVYAPLESARFSARYSFAEAEKIVLRAFRRFSPRWGDLAEKIIAGGHLDSHPRARKRDGAFCATVAPTVVPYVFLNYTDRARDIATLAHELGHGIHSLLASHLPASVQSATLPLAETASTLAELVLFDELLMTARGDRERAGLLERRLSDAYATILRQAEIVRFEIAAHQIITDGATVDDVSDLWLKLTREQFGGAVTVPRIFRHEWSYISHIFHSPFYCYAYSFGQLLALVLYERYRQTGVQFVTQIDELFSAGGSEDPVVLLRRIGGEPETVEFWRSGYAPLTRWLAELALVYDKGGLWKN